MAVFVVGESSVTLLLTMADGVTGTGVQIYRISVIVMYHKTVREH